MPNQKKVIVALSGGVDSSVTCALLLERGFDVEAVFMKNWTPQSEAEGLLMCPLQADEKDARVVSSQLGIKFSTVSFEKEYRRDVVEYLFKEYKEGRTPNPDILCNSQIKFKAFLDYALKRGADFVATGHYVRCLLLVDSGLNNNSLTINPQPQLFKGVDINKDQSYFLYQITQDQLKHCLFPIGEYQKSEVRVLAKKFGLITANKPDSQGICFVGELEIKEFLKSKISPKIGDIITTEGLKIGEHDGVWYYTIGQRRGIGIGGGMPYYVVDKNLEKNQLIVARGDKDEALFKSELVAGEVHWISGVEPKLPLKCSAKIRYRQLEQECVIYQSQISNHVSHISYLKSHIPNPEIRDTRYEIRVEFNEKQRAITPGQFVVFYQGKECLGGGKIL